MGIIRNHIQQMKKENPLEYLRLMRGYESEDDFVRDAVGLASKAIKHHNGGSNHGKRRINNRSVRLSE